MEVLLYDDSEQAQIKERLTELINGTKEVLDFYTACSAKELLQILKEKQPAITILHLAFANGKAAALLNKMKAASGTTAVIALFDIADEYGAGVFNIQDGVYVFDTYTDFEKIPGLIREIKKNQKNSD